MDTPNNRLRIAINSAKAAIKKADRIGESWQPFYLHDGAYDFNVCDFDVADLRALVAAVEGGK